MLGPAFFREEKRRLWRNQSQHWTRTQVTQRLALLVGLKALMFNFVPRQDLQVPHKFLEGAKDRAVKRLQCMRSGRRHSYTDACIQKYFQWLGMKSMRSRRVIPNLSACLQSHGEAFAVALEHVSQRACTTLLSIIRHAALGVTKSAESQRACPSVEGVSDHSYPTV